MRGRKHRYVCCSHFCYIEEIDNPRMRGRKLGKENSYKQGKAEEIDNPRMRGRKPVALVADYKAMRKKLIIPG